jgi:hypothetical protein
MSDRTEAIAGKGKADLEFYADYSFHTHRCACGAVIPKTVYNHDKCCRCRRNNGLRKRRQKVTENGSEDFKKTSNNKTYTSFYDYRIRSA